LQRHFEARRRDLLLEYSDIIPLPNAVFMTKRVETESSIESFFHSYMKENGQQDPLGVLFNCLQTAENAILRELAEKKVTLSEAVIFIGKQSAYEDACSRVPATLLRDKIASFSSSATSFHVLRRSLATQLGVHGALQILLHGAAACPNDLHFSMVEKTMSCFGTVPLYDMNSSVDFKSISLAANTGFVPLRLTRLLKTALSQTLLFGVTSTSLGTTLDAIKTVEQHLESHLAFIFLEDVEDRFPAFASVSSDMFQNSEALAKQSLSETAQLSPSGNYHSRFSQKATQVRASKLPIDLSVQALIRKSIDDQLIAAADVSFLPYL